MTFSFGPRGHISDKKNMGKKGGKDKQSIQSSTTPK